MPVVDIQAVADLPVEVLSYEEVGLAAVTRYASAIRSLCRELTADEEVGLAAAAQNPLALQHVSEELRLQLYELATYWGSGVCSVACAELRRAMQCKSK